MVLQLPEPDAAEQAVAAAHLDPTTATREQLDAAREWERKIRADQNQRAAKELRSRGFDARAYEVLLVEYTDTDPGW